MTVTAHGFETATQSGVEILDGQQTNIDWLLVPTPVLEHELTTLTDQNGNGKVEPGETFQVDEQLINTGHATATGVNATLSTTTPGIEITQATSTYPDIVEGGTGTNSTHFAGVATSELPCGTLIQLRLTVTTNEGPNTVDFTVPGGPPCYGVTSASGQPIIPGTADVGNHCDDCTDAGHDPLPAHVVRPDLHHDARASSNGNLQFGGTRNTAFINSCLPTTGLHAAVIVYWDDLRTDQGGGIFTATTGSAPNRQFIVEWRTTYANRSGNANFEAIFTEGSDVIRMRFGVDADHGLSETVGLQDSATRADEFLCNAGTLQNPGQELTFTPVRAAAATASASSAASSSTTASSTCLRHHHLRHHRRHRRRHHHHRQPAAACPASSACGSARRRRRSAGRTARSDGCGAHAPGARSGDA